jgi:hypothetical protein
MSIHQELKKIKSLPYNVANASEKLELIKTVLENNHSFFKWSDAMFMFKESRLKKMVATELVRHQLSYAINDTSTTFDYKADVVRSIRFNYKDIIDVEPIVIEIFGEQYPALLEKVTEHNELRKEFLERLKTMDENSTKDEVLDVFSKFREGLKKN